MNDGKLHALIDTFEYLWGEDAAAFELERNALTGRDVWVFQRRPT